MNTFRELKFTGAQGETFVDRKYVLEHIQQYAEHFNLLPLIKFGHSVEHIEPVDETDKETQWQVTVKDLKTGRELHEVFDAVFICVGLFNKPHFGLIPNLERYCGPVIHSSSYRSRENYRDKNVMLVGGSISAHEITSQLITVAKKVILCRRTFKQTYPYTVTNLLETTLDLSFQETGVKLPDGTNIKLDAIILCTGYEFHFPFLTKSCKIQVNIGRVSPLYRHMMNCSYPSMVFIGLINGVPFIAAGAEDQVLFGKAVLDGRLKLPTREEMVEDCERDFEERLAEGMSVKQAHRMGKKTWPYINLLAKEAGFETRSPELEKLFLENFKHVFGNPYNFRSVFKEDGFFDK